MRLPAFGSLSTEFRVGLCAIQQPTAPACKPVTFFVARPARLWGEMSRVTGCRVHMLGPIVMASWCLVTGFLPTSTCVMKQGASMVTAS
jgi:hypothetical protein